METFVSEFVQQAIQHNMKVNGGKTKEMLIGPVAKNPPQQLARSGAKVDRVDTSKLFGGSPHLLGPKVDRTCGCHLNHGCIKITLLKATQAHLRKISTDLRLCYAFMPP